MLWTNSREPENNAAGGASALLRCLGYLLSKPCRSGTPRPDDGPSLPSRFLRPPPPANLGKIHASARRRYPFDRTNLRTQISLDFRFSRIPHQCVRTNSKTQTLVAKGLNSRQQDRDFCKLLGCLRTIHPGVTERLFGNPRFCWPTRAATPPSTCGVNSFCRPLELPRVIC
jgi:hypothetical protein